MLRTALRQARGTAGRLAAAGVAIVLGTAFVAAVLLADGLFQRTTAAAVGSAYAGADVVVTPGPDGAGLDEAAVRTLRALPHVAGADGRVDAGAQLSAGGRAEYAALTGAPTVPGLGSPALARGVMPTADGQVALSTSLADRLHVAVGGRVAVRTSAPAPPASTDGQASGSGGPDAEPVPLDVPADVVGLVDDGGAALGGAPTVVATTPQALAWSGAGGAGAGAAYGSVLAVARPGTSPEALRDEVTRALVADSAQQDSAQTATVQTADERTAQAVDSASGGRDVLAGILLSFAALALFVAGVVITNTFSVLVAQRTRQLALLRCVGATAGQVRRGVLLEALLLGLVASAVGVAVGTGLAAAAVAVLVRAHTGVPVPGTVGVSATTVLVPLAAGVLATVLAALGPARAATRVPPLAALRPPQAPDLRTRTSRLRLAACSALVAGGAVMLAAGVLLARAGSSSGLVLALPGGALSFVGVLVGSVFVVPRTVGGLGRLAAAVGGGPARIAAANAVRNPRRTTATTSALLIGVTLVVLMVVGAASTRSTLDAALDRTYPVDVAVGADDAGPEPVAGTDPAPSGPDGSGGPGGSGAQPVPGAVGAAVRAVPGVAAVVPLQSVRASVGPVRLRSRGADAGPSSGTASSTASNTEAGTAARRASVTVRGVDPARARAVVADAGALAPLAKGSVVVPTALAGQLGVRTGQRLDVAVGGTARALTAQVTALAGDTLLVAGQDLAALAPGAPTTRLWVLLDAGADAGAVVGEVRDAVGRATGGQDAVPVEGSAVERAGYADVIDTMLGVVVALLAVAVVIALIGVANTLSLSVIERTRESALLRALGLTRGQLRGMLALEGALVAGVGGLLGTVLGAVYGWSGAAALLGGAGGPLVLAVPWARVAAVLGVAVAAGLLASVLPGRRAARTPPAAALGE